MYTGPVINQW